MRIYKLTDDEETYGEKAGWFICVSDDLQTEFTTAYPTEQEARAAFAKTPEQQVNIQANIALSVPCSVSTDELSTLIRARLGSAFGEFLPRHWSAEISPVNFDFQEEAEIYGTREA